MWYNDIMKHIALSDSVLADLRELILEHNMTVRAARLELNARDIDLSKVSDIDLAQIACCEKED